MCIHVCMQARGDNPLNLPPAASFCCFSTCCWPRSAAAGYVLSMDLVQRIAAGAPQLIMHPHKLVNIEDMAVGMWVEAIGKQHQHTIHHHKFYCCHCSCNSESVILHLGSKAGDNGAMMRCIHKNNGACEACQPPDEKS